LVVLAAFLSLGLPALAQDARPEGPFARPGYRLGQSRVFPSVIFENVYNDNIYASQSRRVGDYVVSIIPRIELASGWTRHFLSASAHGRINRYADVKTENNDEYGVEARGRLDLADQSAIVATFGNGRRTVWRADSENTGREEPQQLEFIEGELHYDHSFARFDLGLRGSVADLDFLDARDADRDRLVFGVSSRLSPLPSAASSLFLQADAKVLDYRETLDDEGFALDRAALGVFVGSSFDTSILEGEVSVGVVHAAFDESSFEDVTILGIRGDLRWEATRLLSLRLELERSLLPTGVAEASSKVRTMVSLVGRHELFRSLILHGDVAYFREDFRQLGRIDDNYRIRAGAEYRINHFFSIAASYSYRQRDSNADNRDFHANIAMLTIEIRL
jgi:hypothetical protein